MTTNATADLATMTPAQIDTLLAPHASERALQQARAWGLRRSAHKALNPRFADSYLAQADTADARAEEAHQLAAPFEAEYARRGGWTRVFWCTANGGHAHSSLACRTLRLDTGMVWLPEHSGATEAEIVELAGDAACTVCYPTAPVATAAPSQLRPAREAREAKAARDAELAAKRDAKAAKAITNPDGTPLIGQWGQIKAVATAWSEASDFEANQQAYGYSFTEEDRATRDRIVEALAAKLGQTVEEVHAELARKVAAKVKRAQREMAKYAR